MISIDEIYKSVQDRAAKNQAGLIKPDQFNRACVKACNDLYNAFRGRTKDYVHQKSSAIVEYAATQHIEDLMTYFFEEEVITPNLEGYLKYPANYEGYRDLEAIGSKVCSDKVKRVVPKEAEVRMRKTDEKTNIINSSIHPPSYERIYAFCEKRNKGIQVIPADAAKKYRLKYFKMITPPKWNYTLTEKGRSFYDAATSTDIDLPLSLTEDVINLVCSEVGIPLSDVDMVQYSEGNIKQKGA